MFGIDHILSWTNPSAILFVLCISKVVFHDMLTTSSHRLEVLLLIINGLSDFYILVSELRVGALC